MRRGGYTQVSYPKLRRALAAMMNPVQRKHKVHGLIEVDITKARDHVREHKTKTGESLSFTAFIITCVARAIDEDKSLHACRKGGRHLVLFDDVDVATLVEREVDGQKQGVIYIIRGANKKTFRQIHDEIRGAQVEHVADFWEGFTAGQWLLVLPLPAIRLLFSLFWWVRERFPWVQKRYGGTVGVSAIGMFGKGAGWGIPLSYHTLDVTVGGIAEKPIVLDRTIARHEFLDLTLSLDHDIVDGAPAARFTARLKALIESGFGLLEEATDEREAVAHPAR